MKKWNWKTTVFGLGSILSGVGVILVKGDLQAGGVAILTGLGLIFAKDFNN